MRLIRRLLGHSPLSRRHLPTRLLLLTTFLLLETLHLITHNPTPHRTEKLSPSLVGQKIFIASIHRNSEYMLRLYWNQAILDLCNFLGPANVFVSIVESGSQEDTKGALEELRAGLEQMGVDNRVLLGERVEEQIWGIEHPPEVDGEGRREGWVESGRGETGWERRRISALADTRNMAMEPLFNDTSRKWDRVLWINDVVFTNEDIATLLSTRDGNYAAACSLDFKDSAFNYYDTFALRDSSGHQTISQSYPFFYSKPSWNAMLNLQPIPVQSCWNGIVAFDASSFYPPTSHSYSHYTPHPSSPNTQNQNGEQKQDVMSPKHHELQSRSTKLEANHEATHLKFRAIPDTLAKLHLEGSECCLIHTDNPLSEHLGVWMNPNVRVTFNESTYPLVNPGSPWPESVKGNPVAMENYRSRAKGKDGAAMRRGSWPGRGEMVWGVWGVRMARLGRWWWWWGWGRAGIERRVEVWEREKGRNGKGGEEELGRGGLCLVDEMQVLYKNGWMHV